jgi:site-specific DNA recombinase
MEVTPARGKLQAAPERKRAASYVRVSSEEQLDGFSLDAQERAIADYSRDHGYQIVAPYRDEGKSARNDDMPSALGSDS